MENNKNIESLLEDSSQITDSFDSIESMINSGNESTAIEAEDETSLLDTDNRVAADLVEDVATAVDSEEALAERQRIIDEHNRRVMQSPEFKAQVMFDNYVNTCGRILDGQTKRRLKRQFLNDAKRGKFDMYFDPEKIAKRQAREQAKFDKLNAPVIHKVEEIDEETQETLKKMAEMEVIK